MDSVAYAATKDELFFLKNVVTFLHYTRILQNHKIFNTACIPFLDPLTRSLHMYRAFSRTLSTVKNGLLVGCTQYALLY